MFQFDSFTDFLTMSGHGPFVWFSFAITFLVLIVLVIVPKVQKKQLVQQLQRQQRIDEAKIKQASHQSL